MADDLKLKIQVEVDDKIDSSKIEKQAEKAGQEIWDNVNKWISGSIAKWMAIWDTIKGAIQKVRNMTKQFLQDSLKLGIEYESAFAWVKKTVDWTAQEFNKLDNSLKKMAKEIPLTYKELAGIMELWWQLGVQTKDLDKFTRSVAKLGTATNLTSENAAQMLAQFANITKMDLNDIDKLGSVIVDLWNNFATTESDIVNFAQRIAGAWEIAWISQANIMAIATAFSSVGIEAEAWGTAVQKVLLDMNSAVTMWWDQLEKYAKIVWMTTDEFKKLYEEHPEKALVEFVKALQNSGQEAQALLDALWLNDQRLVRGFLSLSQNADILTQAIDRSNEAWEQNIALSNEAEQRFSTTESQMIMQQNERANMMAEIWEKMEGIALRWEKVKTTFVDAIGSFLGVTMESNEATEMLEAQIKKVIWAMEDLDKELADGKITLQERAKKKIEMEDQMEKAQEMYKKEKERLHDLQEQIDTLTESEQFYQDLYKKYLEDGDKFRANAQAEMYRQIHERLEDLLIVQEAWIELTQEEIEQRKKQKKYLAEVEKTYQDLKTAKEEYEKMKSDDSSTRAELEASRKKVVELTKAYENLISKMAEAWIGKKWNGNWITESRKRLMDRISSTAWNSKDSGWVLGDELLWWWGGGWWSKSKAEDMLKSFKDEMKDVYSDMDSAVSEHQKNYDNLVKNIEKTEKEYDKLREKATDTWKDAEKAIKKYNEELEKSQTEWIKSLWERYVDLQEQRREIDDNYLKWRIGDITDSDWKRIRDEWYTYLWYTYDELKKIKEIYDEIKLIEENTTDEQRASKDFTEKTSKAQEILNDMKEKEAELEEKKAIAMEKQAIAQAAMSQENWKQYIKTLEDKGTFYYDTVKKQREQIHDEDNIEYAKQLENQITNLNDQLKQFKDEKDNEVEILTTITARKIELEKEYEKKFKESIDKQKLAVEELYQWWERLIAKKNEYYSWNSVSARAYGWDISNAKVALVWENWPERIVARTASYIQPRNASNSYSTVNNDNSSNFSINWMQVNVNSMDEFLEDLKWRLTYRD